MADETLDPVLAKVDSRKRAFLKKLVLGTSFAVPIVASYSVKDLAFAQASVTVTIITTTEL